jgi:hypothetical protein
VCVVLAVVMSWSCGQHGSGGRSTLIFPLPHRVLGGALLYWGHVNLNMGSLSLPFKKNM